MSIDLKICVNATSWFGTVLTIQYGLVSEPLTKLATLKKNKGHIFLSNNVAIQLDISSNPQLFLVADFSSYRWFFFFFPPKSDLLRCVWVHIDTGPCCFFLDNALTPCSRFCCASVLMLAFVRCEHWNQNSSPQLLHGTSKRDVLGSLWDRDSIVLVKCRPPVECLACSSEP